MSPACPSRDQVVAHEHKDRLHEEPHDRENKPNCLTTSPSSSRFRPRPTSSGPGSKQCLAVDASGGFQSQRPPTTSEQEQATETINDGRQQFDIRNG